MGSLFKSKSQKSTSNSTSTSEPWQPAQGNLKDILGDISSWYDQAQQTGYISPTGDLGSIYQQYLQGLNGAGNQITQGTNNLLNQGMDVTNQALQGYQGLQNGSMNYGTGDIVSGAQGLINNDLLQGQINAVNSGIQRNLQEQAFTGIDRNAVAGGNAGSSRAGVAQAIAARDASEQMANNEANIRANAYNNALNQSQSVLNQNIQNQLTGLQGTAQLGNQIYNNTGNYINTIMGQLAPSLQSAQLQQMIQGQQQTDQIGQRDFLANLISSYYLPVSGSVGGMGGFTTGTGTQTTPGGSTFGSILGAGQAAGNIWNSFSDKRLKKNIKYIGTEAGHKIYTWDWTKRGEEIAGKQPTRGVIAQEVMKTHPDAVTKDPSTGYLVVDYTKL